MPRFFGPRRLLAYGAYFGAAFSILLGLYLGPHAWRLQNTIWAMEKYYDSVNTDHRQSRWVDKAIQAALARQEDLSEYNDRFWALKEELETTGHFDRSNLTASGDARDAPDWARANADFDKWGFVVYRVDYGDDDETWPERRKQLTDTVRVHLELAATLDVGVDTDPEHVRDRAVLEFVEDKELLDGANLTTVRSLWRKRVDDGLVDSGMKMGGWDYGWFKLNLNLGRDADGDGDGDAGNVRKINGMALNLCLVYDWDASFMLGLMNYSVPNTGPRDPWEPFLLALDGMYDSPERYMYKTSWAHGYAGFYGVALSVLFTDFHQATYERDMEKSAPAMHYGGAAVHAEGVPWWQRAFYTDKVAVARPGRFPFHQRLQELVYPIVTAESRWNITNAPEASSEQEPAEDASPGDGDPFDVEKLLKFDDDDTLFYLPCTDEDDPKDCMQLGNLRVKKPKEKEEQDPVATETSSG